MPTRTEEHIATTPGCGPAGRRAFAHTDTPSTLPDCRSCAFAPSPAGARPRPPARAKENFARRRAADLAALRALVRRLASKKTSPRAPLLTTPTRAEENLAVTPGCKPRAPDALLLTPTRAEE